jgi:nitroreductase
VILRRRSAVAFDPRPSLSREAFDRILDRVSPPGLPFDAWPWPAHVNLVVFVHRVEGLTPGLYSYVRNPSTREAWRGAMRPEFLWEPADPHRPLDLLVPTDVTFVANRLSCDQSIASDGYLSLGMVARFAPSLRDAGEAAYRRLFWECGLIGQALYLEAEAVGARGTGIGCFFDDAVHEMLGLTNHEWQSLYHFSLGQPIDDTRLTTHPGYDWE